MDELSVDKFHEKKDQLFQVMGRTQLAGEIGVDSSTPWALAQTLVNEMPEIEYAASASLPDWFPKFTLSVENKNIKATGQYVSKDYFNMFSFHLFQGDKNQVLSDKSSIVISEKLAMKLFNTTENLIGKVVKFQQDAQYFVSGVFKNIPPNSSTQFDFALSYQILTDKSPENLNWNNFGPATYVTLKPGTNLSQFNNKIAGLIKTRNKKSNVTLFLRPFSDGYLYEKYENGAQAGGRIEYLRQFSIIAIFILIIACINFMNLSTAKASRRIKEVGIKKVIGVLRRTLVFQYLGESMLIAFLSLFLAIIIVVAFLPQFNNITGKHLILHANIDLILSLLGITLVTGLISGSYPAVYLSGFNPATVLKGKVKSSLAELWVREGLVVFQFTLSVILIVSVLIVYKQIEFIQSKNLGYNKDNIIYFPREGKVYENLETFLTEVKNIPGTLNASSIGQGMFSGSNTTTGVYWQGKNPDDIISFARRPVNYDAIEMLGIELKEGRAFSRDFGADTSTIIVNEAAIGVMGLRDPIGKVIDLRNDKKRQIVGVIKNFHYESLRSSVSPMFFVLSPENTQYIIVKIEAGKERETIDKLQQFYTRFNPGFSFDYKFLDEDYQAQYSSEKRVAALSRYFAGLAILISCLGLFGLASFTAERRRKEIGIRKVLGSSNFNIIYLLSSDFTKLVLAAIVIALPVSYLIIKHWLNNFAYRIELEPWYFIGAGLMALVIAWLTVSMQAIKAAVAKPVKSLRTE
jgi:putative ABC transport system permease protein